MVTRYRITAPVAHVVSTIAGVAFQDSVGETDSLPALAYFRRHGYTVEEIAEPAKKAAKKTAAPKVVEQTATPPVRPADDAAQEDWAAYAVARGLDPADAAAATVEQLVELTKEPADDTEGDNP